MEGIKFCTKCELELPLEAFHKSSSTKDGYQSQCASCKRKSQAEARDRHEEAYGIRANAGKVRKMYGCSLDEYAERMSSSDCCEICESTDKLCYDHDHNTMKFRGVLCRSCNAALGHLGDNIEGVSRALTYLEKSYED